MWHLLVLSKGLRTPSKKPPYLASLDPDQQIDEAYISLHQFVGTWHQQAQPTRPNHRLPPPCALQHQPCSSVPFFSPRLSLRVSWPSPPFLLGLLSAAEGDTMESLMISTGTSSWLILTVRGSELSADRPSADIRNSALLPIKVEASIVHGLSKPFTDRAFLYSDQSLRCVLQKLRN